jgi:GTP-binding protein
VHTRAPTVVLVGRPNVGKSTLFNRIAGKRRSIVTPTAGTTRDVISESVLWSGVAFQLVDTGGMFGASEDPLHELVLAGGRKMLEAADVIVLVVDGREGQVPADNEIAAAARVAGAPVIVAINKMDDRRARNNALDFYQLGFEPVVEIAAEHGLGIGDLLEGIVSLLGTKPAGTRRPGLSAADSTRDADQAEPSTEATRSEIGVAIVGRPNVGKSSLVNRLLREERVLVSELPGTTRDAVDAVLMWHRRQFRIVDTAGIRRPGRVSGGGQVEQVSVLIAKRALGRADVAVVVIDATEGPTDQDAAIAGEADRTGRGIIIAANKWDLVKDRGAGFSKEFDETVRDRLKFLDYAPVLHISARTGERTPRLLEMIDKVAEARTRRVPTGELNRFIEAVTTAHPPVSPGRRQVRILYAAQISTAPPFFVFFTNVATTFHFSYERYLVNRLRESFGFLGTPIRMDVRARGRKARG